MWKSVCIISTNLLPPHRFTSLLELTIQATIMSQNSQWGKMKQSLLSSIKRLGLQYNRMLTYYSLQNVQYQETDQNQIKLPTWGILFNKTLTEEDETKLSK